MKRLILFFAVSFILASCLALWVSGNLAANRSDNTSDQAAWAALHREAELIDHFCLSSVPPLFGKATIPSEWERSLKTTIRLREGMGEIASEGPEFKTRADDIRALQAKQSIQMTVRQGGGPKHMLVYKPASGQQYLFLAKNDADLKREFSANTFGVTAAKAIGFSFVFALLLTILAHFLWRK
jgi:hypothetical protein